MINHVLFIAPITREDGGIVTRLRRYENTFSNYGFKTESVDPTDDEMPIRSGSWIHMIDPLGVAIQWLSRRNGSDLDVIVSWLRFHAEGFTVTVTKLPTVKPIILHDQILSIEAFLERIFTETRVIFVTSEKLAKQFKGRYPRSAHKVEVVGIGLDIIEFNGCKEETKLCAELKERLEIVKRRVQYELEGRRMILYAGKMSADRSLSTFIRVVHNLQKERSDVRGVMVGPIADVRDVKKIFGELKRTGVSYIGAFDRELMKSIFFEAAIVWDPSQELEVSASIYEAMWFGKPVLVHTQTVAPTVLPKDTVFTYTDEMDAAARLRMVLDSPILIEHQIPRASRFIRSHIGVHTDVAQVLKRIVHEIKLIDERQSVS